MLAEQKRAGKIRHLGVSILQKGSEFQARAAAKFGVEALQVFYNRLDRRAETMYFPHAQRDQLGVLARVPLASGLLSGKYKPGTTFAANDVRATFDAEKLKRDLAEVERLQKEEVPPGMPAPITFMARTSAAVFQSPSAPKPYPSAIRRCTARPGSCARPYRSSKVVVKALKPPYSRKARIPISIRAASRNEERWLPF